MNANTLQLALNVKTKPKETKAQLRRVLAESDTVDAAAEKLGVSRETLYRTLKRLKMKSGKPAHRPVGVKS